MHVYGEKLPFRLTEQLSLFCGHDQIVSIVCEECNNNGESVEVKQSR